MSNNNNSIDFKHLETRCQKPELFANDDGNFWADSYISEHLLNAHLDDDTEEGSRNYETITKTVDFICKTTQLKPQAKVLDLGCGPGLYSEQFADKGYTVTGVDISQNSINYANEQCQLYNRKIDYRCKNYLDIDYENEFDIVTLIYGDLCVLSHTNRATLLQKVHKALKPNGILVFDVFTKHYINNKAPEQSWYISTCDGFWAEQAHLVLESHFAYPKDNVHLDKYTLIFEDGSTRTHHIWKHYFSLKSVKQMLSDEKFEAIYIGSDLKGSCLKPNNRWIGVIAKKIS